MPAAIFARLALTEARRGGLVWLALATVGLALALGAFLSQLALTESRMLQAGVVAALLRVCAVFMVTAMFVMLPRAAAALRNISAGSPVSRSSARCSRSPLRCPHSCGPSLQPCSAGESRSLASSRSSPRWRFFSP